jgi:hypothetical protein
MPTMDEWIAKMTTASKMGIDPTTVEREED